MTCAHMLLGVLKPWNPWLRPSHLPANVFQGLLEESLALCPRECVWLLVPSSHKNPLNVLYGQILPAFPRCGFGMFQNFMPHSAFYIAIVYCRGLLFHTPLQLRSFLTAVLIAYVFVFPTGQPLREEPLFAV